MSTVATFSQIRKTLRKHIEQSKSTIKISVAWFTSKDLIGLLTDKMGHGCKVEIIISDDILNKRLPTKDFIDLGGLIYVLPRESGKFLHEKYAIFDDSTVIAGSYNWTNFAEYMNHEFVIISSDTTLVKQFTIRFNSLKKVVNQYSKEIFTNLDNETADKNELYFYNLEKDLEREFISTIREANDLDARISSDYVISFLNAYGAIGGANRLIIQDTEKLQTGLLKLWEINRLDLSFESIILKDKYRILFDEEILTKAQQRLNKLN